MFGNSPFLWMEVCVCLDVLRWNGSKTGPLVYQSETHHGSMQANTKKHLFYQAIRTYSELQYVFKINVKIHIHTHTRIFLSFARYTTSRYTCDWFKLLLNKFTIYLAKKSNVKNPLQWYLMTTIRGILVSDIGRRHVSGQYCSRKLWITLWNSPRVCMSERGLQLWLKA